MTDRRDGIPLPLREREGPAAERREGEGTAAPTLIVFSGLPATGKSTLAERVARHLAISIFSVDPIEAAMLRAGIAQSHETGVAAYVIAESLAAAQLRIGRSAIVDAVNAVEIAKDMWRSLAKAHAVPLRIIECVCSDAALHRERLRTRQRETADILPAPSWEKVERRRLEYTRWTEPFLAVDTLASCDANLVRILAWLDLPSARPKQAGAL
jgi:predicted kinase